MSSVLAVADRDVHSASIVQWSIVAIFPVVILAVDVGGFALAARLRRQLDESIELASYANGHVSVVRAGQHRMDADMEGRRKCWNPCRPAGRVRPGHGSTAVTPQGRKVLALRKAVTDLQTVHVSQLRPFPFTPRPMSFSRQRALTASGRQLTSAIAFVALCLFADLIWVAWCAADPETKLVHWP